MRAVVKSGWHQAGRKCTVLAPDVSVLQNWTPVLWDDEEDPDFVKSAALEKEESTEKADNTTKAEISALVSELEDTVARGNMPYILVTKLKRAVLKLPAVC